MLKMEQQIMSNTSTIKEQFNLMLEELKTISNGIHYEYRMYDNSITATRVKNPSQVKESSTKLYDYTDRLNFIQRQLNELSSKII
jgi:transcriptional regulator of NAD metabolism